MGEKVNFLHTENFDMARFGRTHKRKQRDDDVAAIRHTHHGSVKNSVDLISFEEDQERRDVGWVDSTDAARLAQG